MTDCLLEISDSLVPKIRKILNFLLGDALVVPHSSGKLSLNFHLILELYFFNESLIIQECFFV